MNKQLLLLAVCIIAAISAGASGRNDTKIRNWQMPATFTSITVSNNIDIILAESGSQQISIEGRSRFVDAVKLEVVDGELRISGCKSGMCGKVRLYIPVSQLQKLTVRGTSEVNTMGILNSPRLLVNIEGHCLVNVKTKGKVVIKNEYGYEIDYVKNNQIAIKDSSL